MEGWPDPPGWDMQYDNESRRWNEECAKRLARCEADMRVMRKWPEYKPETEKTHESDSERHPEHV